MTDLAPASAAVMPPATSPSAAADELFVGPGEMRALHRAKDWSATSLGPVERWPISLRTVARAVLAARQPCFLFWGRDLVQLFNDAYRPILGDDGRHVQALGANGAEFWAENWAILGPEIAGVMAGGEATWHEDRLVPILRNGQLEEAYGTYGYSAVHDDAGAIAGVLVLCQETTRRVRAERAYAEQTRAMLAAQGQAARFLEQVADAYLAMDAEFRIITVNAAAERFLGAPRASFIGRTHWEAFPETVGSVIEAPYHRAMRDRVHVHLDTPYVGDGLDVHVEIDAYPTDDGGLALFWRDVTAQVRAREQLAAAETQLRMFADAIPTLAWTARADGYIDWYNAQWYAYTGTTPREMEGWGWQAVHDPAVLPGIMTRWQASIATGEPFEMTFPLRGADGTFQSFLTRSVPARDADGTVLRWFGTNTNIEAEQQLRRAAEDANRAKSEFLAVMSHELRTPLNAIDGYAELIELGIRGPVSPEQRQDLARIRKSQRHLLGLINGVLNYAQVEAGATYYEIDAVSVDEVLTMCESLTLPQARRASLTLQHTPCDPALLVRADREKLQQVVLNLLSNAIKFTEPGGRIDLQCTSAPDASGAAVYIRVTDTGIGIGPAHLTRIFDPFVQVNSELTRTREGAGLGLAISRDLARGMGGELTVESTPGAGSTFTVTLSGA
ncbi:MAG TPA: ATP-binding protein [Gemmatimonas sp.]|nr:ATP-binding protein [Gemmatimonas sp.]